MINRLVQRMFQLFKANDAEETTNLPSETVKALQALQESRQQRLSLEQKIAESQVIAARLREQRQKNNLAEVFERAIRGGRS